jgi:hypothetical protein
MSHDDQRRRADAEALLRRPSWTDEETDHAVALHDLLLSPDLPPDPVGVALRKRLAGVLTRRPGPPRSSTWRSPARAGWR